MAIGLCLRHSWDLKRMCGGIGGDYGMRNGCKICFIYGQRVAAKRDGPVIPTDESASIVFSTQFAARANRVDAFHILTCWQYRSIEGGS